MLDFNGKVVFITGTSGHIAKATADLFVQQGATVIGADIAYPVCDSGDINFSANPVEIHLDVTDTAMIDAVLGLCEEKFGRIDIVINAAGIGSAKGFLELTEEDWDRTLDINLKGLFFICQRALKHMIEQKGGCFVNFASISGKVGGVLAGAEYSASKAGVICVTKSLAKTGAPYKIRANSIAPGAIYSPMLTRLYYQEHEQEMEGFEKNHLLGRFGEAREVANTVLFLASDESSWINGACIDINGGSLMD